MTIGEKIRQGRIEQGLSQRQLCGDKITRNMLSLIENGSAKPSMDTLAFLAGQLGKPISYFLSEDAATSPNAAVMETARTAFAIKDYAKTLTVLKGFQRPDPLLDGEKGILETLCCLFLAQQAMDQGREPYARQLLERVDQESPYFEALFARHWQILMGQLPPADDRELLLRAEHALGQGDPARAICYLHAAEDHCAPRWHLLCGRACFSQKDYKNAIICYQNAASTHPRESLEALENCYRESGDFENAYRCACKLREM